MSFLGRGASTSNGGINHERLEMAMNEIEMVSDVFNRIVSSCHGKCISNRYAEGDLNKGESVCIDRCVAKFFDVNKKVGEKMQAAGANAQATGSSSFSL
ncbi:Tim10/DDP family zinc finger-domain-containing protein [Hygrophoropsis aurantiaca]|uniref:Tim10/DDP family zinc finger-domain-containing protein n=1 Tax=Hygrophoropsis aurantiaca TaxID=72124 RepID=A0ACB8ADQ5_9AGAM|nr:Tim10/DDP family zinc finger-domain-containing protein [Hygrophoropsis aurantiaca]